MVELERLEWAAAPPSNDVSKLRRRAVGVVERPHPRDRSDMSDGTRRSASAGGAEPPAGGGSVGGLGWDAAPSGDASELATLLGIGLTALARPFGAIPFTNPTKPSAMPWARGVGSVRGVGFAPRESDGASEARGEIRLRKRVFTVFNVFRRGH